MNSVLLPSYAKINLCLFVKGKRSDGYHEIETLIQQVNLKDDIELTIRDEPGIELSCDHPDVPRGEENLCVRAATHFMQATNIQRGIRIKLHKVIPMGAGLGGGSSNAAVVLMGLSKLWQENLEPHQLLDLASQLGSDVPFFIEGGLAVARGRGERLYFCEQILDKPVLLVYPRINISTAWAYNELNLGLTMNEKNIKLGHFKVKEFNNVDFYQEFKNDFEKVVFEKFPLLQKIKEQISEKNSLFSGLSGSGSTLFGIFRERHEALEAKRFFEKKYLTFVTDPLKWGYGGVL
ncbi:4-(cytidine 5'-diphospho)-2-C-methyl-D-erythritol kinase [candidate division KSB1 bacterium]|nr:4-(cytidine 5'-diphospho)-2-C-methyl-D-erythritol kinase [candidate division KSB1 bacterium]NIR69911.1 4-(cytidine 5'-diphospho)-2-C-methyl-D-erythritol kinase [candidate division KSB1 bacterium]NIS25820.1 4-(cytidine 5'-diphospho)-2-C-methyl-D-erythritol kinase [candidate division KSB1 bacterium]NIT72695.1 4-(cytidine 5'-diphospho)-2-C-methyl-D-erythritol kinase [candidate division KSB1 bacterium]NIU26509.1 4-(cytidine 5'-diphospho)-2-C-methyl-D-erythritol kinase [candidate division KSB1 ba